MEMQNFERVSDHFYQKFQEYVHVRVDSWQVHVSLSIKCLCSFWLMHINLFFQILVTLDIILVLSMHLLLSHLLVYQQGEKHTWLKNWVVISTGLASRLKVTM